jgi:beta-glucosidase
MEDDLRERLARLSLERKVQLLTGADFWALYDEPAIGLRRLVMSDGPAGVRGERWDEREPSANVPSPTALAATWDEERVERLGDLLAAECRRKGVDVLLAPTVNLHRTPYGGRHFECFSEDPLLTARIGIAYVNGLQRAGVGATVKHFVANDSETERFTLDARVDERTLRELYAAPFEAIVDEARPWAVMAAYNGVNGHTMTESPLLGDVLKAEWGWDGLVMSDWFAARSLAAAAAALDLVMPGPHGPWGDALVAAVREGRVPESAVDEKVLRLLRLAAREGALDGVGADAEARRPAAWSQEDVAAELRATAAASFVLARNHGALLPLSGGSLRRVAVLGPNAAVARTLGGGSATVYPSYTVSPLDGLRAALAAAAEVTTAPGVLATPRIPVAAPPWVEGSEVRFLAGDGSVLASEQRPACAFNWLGSYGPAVDAARVAAIEVHAVLRATGAGTYTVAVSGVGRYRLSVDGAEVFAGEISLAPGADVVEALMIPPQRTVQVELAAGAQAHLVLAHEAGSLDTGIPDFAGASFQLNVLAPYAGDDAEIERAVALAREADVAVVVVGTTEEVESEGFDRASLALPGRQDELVRRVAEANPKTVVVVNAGAPVLLPWADEVAAVLLAWFPGQEFGRALAGVLLGELEPGGRLPTTWPLTEAGLPSTQPVDGVVRYAEDIYVGYRSPDRDARYVFGHGLGYTTWEYLSLEAGDGEAVVRVRNAGDRPGREVVQIYASRPDSAVDRPARWLVGFATVDAGPGEEVAVRVPIARRALEHWDGGWRLEPGAFTLAAGSSLAALPLTARLTV